MDFGKLINHLLDQKVPSTFWILDKPSLKLEWEKLGADVGTH